MAKQNVTFAERHLEKVVIGVAGAVLAAVIFLYVVNDPYTIDVHGKMLGPSAFYNRLDEMVGDVANRFKSPPSLSPPEWKAPPAVGKTSTNLPVVFVPVNPPVPKGEAGIELGGKLELVQILPPSKPALTVGRGLGALEVAQVKVIGEKQTGSTNREKEELKDHFWTAVFATVPRRDQQEQFIKAQYALDRQHLMVSKVEVERQKLLANGEWEERGESVMPFASLVLSCPPTVPLASENGEVNIEPADYALIQELMTEASSSQAAILRPDFQTQLEVEVKTEWKPPAELPGGAKFDWAEEYKIALPDKTNPVEGTTPGGRSGIEKSSAPRVSTSKAIDEINKLIAKGQVAESQKDYLAAKTSYTDADQKIDLLLTGGTTSVPEKDKTRLNDLQTQIKAKLQVLATGELKLRESRAAAKDATLGPDVDLCWITDATVKPGETYRYRVRLLAVNPHAGLLRRLKKPEDAAKIILTGQWSEWSDAASVQQSDHLFFTGVDAATQNIKTELYHWNKGEWKIGRQNLAIGQPVSWTQSLQAFSYDGIVVSLDNASTHEDRTVRRKAIRYGEARPTAAVTLVKSNGDVEEHLIAADVSRKRELSDELLPKKTRETQDRPSGLSPREGETGSSGRSRGAQRGPGVE